MNLFLKIFLWFLAAISLMTGVVLLLNWSVQTEPVVSRWRVSVRNQTTIYAETAGQIYESEGQKGLLKFLERIRTSETMSEVDVVGPHGQVWAPEGVNVENYRTLVDKAFASGSVEIEVGPPESSTALSARHFLLSNGERYVLVVRWERPHPMPFFGETYLRYIRYAVLLVSSFILCWLLAKYLSSPIGKIRRATQKLAAGDLKTRVGDEVGNRRDELADLARDFDDMAERIESLITSQQRLSRDVSHELRSPLARLNVALEMAKQRSNGAAAPQLARIERESERLNEMIGRILTLSKLESGSRDFEHREISLSSLLKQIVADSDFEAQANGRSVRLIHSDSYRIIGSESLLASAVENVLRNAVKYTREHTSVDVSLNVVGSRATLSVRDYGHGVPDDDLDKLFRPFYRVGEARERQTGGIGLGLSIAKRAVSAHNGSITAKNLDDGLLVEIVLDSALSESQKF
ncbi:MAG: ATP-binding protein [Pyrinomonadaceae bacterium]